LHEECGLFGVFANGNAEVRQNIAHLCYSGLYALQHRGQESAGIAVNGNGAITNRRDLGLVSEVFTQEKLRQLGKGGGEIAIAHVRYATTGNSRRYNAQPLVVKHIKGSLALGHNGNLTNAVNLRRTLELEGSIFHASSDTEVIIHTIVRERLSSPSIEKAVETAMSKINGAYSLVLMSKRKLIACRDPNGFRPLCIGKLGESIIFASESCALNAIGADFVRDIKPGEIVVVSEKDGMKSITTHCGKKSSLCVFEYVYFARPDSVIDGISVHDVRVRSGEMLAKEHPADADVVIGVPDSGLDAALGYSRASGIPYDFGFLKNKYIGRTFIAPNQKDRESSVRIKLNPIVSAVKNKRVVIVDDSIVRGTTSMKIIQLLRKAGAKEVHMRLSCPPFLYPCYFGTDIDTSENLIAYRHTLYEIRDLIGADTLGYLSIKALSEICADSSSGLCDACFSKNYPVDVSGAQLKTQFEQDIDTD
jgi:amidophosphoribosyltransferase